jgi:hypothetical protein
MAECFQHFSLLSFSMLPGSEIHSRREQEIYVSGAGGISCFVVTKSTSRPLGAITAVLLPTAGHLREVEVIAASAIVNGFAQPHVLDSRGAIVPCAAIQLTWTPRHMRSQSGGTSSTAILSGSRNQNSEPTRASGKYVSSMTRLNQGQIILTGVEKAVKIVLPYGKGALDRTSLLGGTSDPTTLFYAECSAIWAYFNEHLFGGRLRPCIITLRCGRGAFGYYAHQRFETRDGTFKVDEIALNAETFHAYSLTDTLSTIAHEQSHALQFLYGHPSPGGYHNKEWAGYMERIGLIPSDTGKEGGRKTGVHMSQYIQPDGLFARVCADLIAQGIGISFVDRWAATAKADSGTDYRQDRKQARRNSKVANRTLFRCPECGQGAWGKPSLKIDCRPCSRPMSVPVSDGESHERQQS